MAAGYTLASLLFRLGFDTSQLTVGAAQAKAQLASIGAAAAATQAQMAAAGRFPAGAMMGGAGVGGRFASATQQQAYLASLVTPSQAAAGQIVAAQDKVGASLGKLSQGYGMLKVMIGTLAVLAVAQFLAGSVSAATTFQQQMMLVETQARATSSEVATMSEAILKMAPAVQTGPIALAQGLYHIESVGIRGAKALDILRVAAEGARVGVANIEDVTNALVAAVMSSVGGITSMTQAMGVLNGIVGSGNMRMQDLSDSLRSGVLASAKVFGLTLQDLGAALATMSDQGIPAVEAATRLRISIALIGAPTPRAAQELSKIGLTARALGDDMRKPNGLILALQDLQDHLQGAGLDATEQAAIIKNAFGGSRTSSGIMTLIGSIELMRQKMVVINETSANFETTFARQSETAAAKFATFGAQIEVLKVQVGNILLPVLTGAAVVLGHFAEQTLFIQGAVVALTVALGVLSLRALKTFILYLIQSIQYIGLGKLANMALAGSMTVVNLSSILAANGVRAFAIAAAAALGPLGLLVIALTAVATAYSMIKGDVDKQAAALNEKATQFAQVTPLDELIKARNNVQKKLDELKQGFHPIEDLIGLSGVSQTEDVLKILDDRITALQATGGVDPTQALLDQINNGTSGVLDATKTLVEQFGADLGAIDAAAVEAGGKAMTDMAKEIQAHQQDPLDAFKTLTEMVRNQLEPTAEIARLMAEKTSTWLVEGLHSQDPAVYGWAVGVQKMIIARLDEISGGAYSAAQEAANSYGAGWASSDALAALVGAASGNAQTAETKAALAAAIAAGNTLANEWNNKWAPSADAVAKGVAALNAELMKTPAYTSAISDLNSAFADIKSSADAYFSEVHTRTTQAIEDANKNKNAIIDVKNALIQAPVTAAQKALDFQRSQIQEWRLRAAIPAATDPAGRRDAILALQDFLAQAHINDMQNDVDAQKKVLDTQKKTNDDRAALAKQAEDLRYKTQQANFAADLKQLQDWLAKNPGQWATANAKILALLKKYGLDLNSAGTVMGASFKNGLQTQLDAAVAATKAAAEAISLVLGTLGTASAESYVPVGAEPGNAQTAATKAALAAAIAAGSTSVAPVAPTPAPKVVVPTPYTGPYWAPDPNTPGPIPRPTAAPTPAPTPTPQPTPTSLPTPTPMPAPGPAPTLWTPTPTPTPRTLVGSRPVPLQSGMWHIMQNNLLATLHRDEMVAPASVAALLRQLGSQPTASGPWTTLGSGATGSLASTPTTGGGPLGGRTLIIQIGEEKFAEISDRALAQQDRIYGQQTLPKTGSLR